MWQHSPHTEGVQEVKGSSHTHTQLGEHKHWANELDSKGKFLRRQGLRGTLYRLGLRHLERWRKEPPFWGKSIKTPFGKEIAKNLGGVLKRGSQKPLFF